MQKVKFTPTEFSKIELGPDKGEVNDLTPDLNHHLSQNQFLINVPNKIHFKDIDPSLLTTDTTFIFPVCGESFITEKRVYYYCELINPVFHIRKMDTEEWLVAEYNELPAQEEWEVDIPVEMKEEMQGEIEEAQKLIFLTLVYASYIMYSTLHFRANM